MPISKPWKSEDWLAVWIGFIIISIGCVSVLTGAFDFSAAKFSTWHLWENVPEAKSLAAQFSGTFWALIIGLAISNTVGIGAYYYADIPGFEKIMNDEVYQTSVPLWVHIALFLGWGYLMWRLWIWIDKR